MTVYAIPDRKVIRSIRGVLIFLYLCLLVCGVSKADPICGLSLPAISTLGPLICARPSSFLSAEYVNQSNFCQVGLGYKFIPSMFSIIGAFQCVVFTVSFPLKTLILNCKGNIRNI